MMDYREKDSAQIDDWATEAASRKPALSSLLQHCEHMVPGKELTLDEVLFLNAWLKDNHQLRANADLSKLVDSVGDVLEEGLVTHECLEDIRNLLHILVTT